MDCKQAQRLVTAYINHKITDYKQLEDFLDHVLNCKECWEELETYYTVQVGLEQLENMPHGSYDIHRLLDENIKESQRKIHIHKMQMLYSFAGVFVLLFVVCFCLLYFKLI